jgi:hypothetical protein
LLVAYAEPAAGGGIHARMVGASPLGKITFDKNYVADTGTEHDSALLAVQRFHKVMVDKYQSDVAKAQASQQAAAGPASIPVNIPFAGPSQWNGLRARILSTPGVLGVDLKSLDVQGASARLLYSGDIGAMQNSLQSAGLQLTQTGSGWVIQSL